MTVKELYDEAVKEHEDAFDIFDKQTARAALGLQAFILILIERGTIFWDDDSSRINRVHHDVKRSSSAVKDKTNQMIIDKMMDL